MSTPELIACLGFTFFFALLFSTLLLLRWFRHKETLAMIERGLLPASAARPRNGKATLAWGIGITVFGLALLGGSWPFSFLWATVGGPRGALLLPGLIVLFIGVALLIVYFASRPEPAEETLETTLSPAEASEMPDLPPLEAEKEETPGA